MKRINVRAAAVEAVLTRHGTVVGPLMTDLTGHPELTPHKGGWCGNDIFPDALSPEHLERARLLTQKLGDRLMAEGYRGFLEVDYLADADTGELYLGEINPRISGVTSMTNVTAGAYADVPLFLFHLLEYSASTTRSTSTTSTAAGRGAVVDVLSQIILKQTARGSTDRRAEDGIWRLDEAAHQLRPLGPRLAQPAGRGEASTSACWAGRLLLPGADLGVLVARSCRRPTTTSHRGRSSGSTVSSPVRRHRVEPKGAGGRARDGVQDG
jgi:hypothetical protein